VLKYVRSSYKFVYEAMKQTCHTRSLWMGSCRAKQRPASSNPQGKKRERERTGESSL